MIYPNNAPSLAANQDESIDNSRRRLLRTAGGGLIIAMALPAFAQQKSGVAAILKNEEGETNTLVPNAFVRIAPDDTVTVMIKHIEFGQGPFTGLATLVAEELDADWSQMRAEHAPADNELYKNLAFGIQGTGGSTAIANAYMQMRRAGATARAMLVNAAAEEWQVPASEIRVSKGLVSHTKSGKQASFGKLAEKAASMPRPSGEPVLKNPSQFVLIGRDLPKLDTLDKTRGEAQFTLDVYKDKMLTAVVAHAPLFGATLKGFDDKAARAIPGVVDVKRIPQGVAVYAKNTHVAIRGRDALDIEWDTSQAEKRSTDQMIEEFSAAAKKTGATAAARGDSQKAMQDGDKILEAEYVFPYLAHAPMEPLDAVVLADGKRVDAWLGSQLQTIDQGAIAGVFGIEPQNVYVHTLLAGGSFGRRAQAAGNFAAEAAEVAKAAGQGVPVKLVWTREDDIRGGRYRPLTVHRMRAALDKKGNIASWEQTIAVQSILANTPFEGMIQNGIDPSAVEGASDMPYAIANFKVDLNIMETGVPVLWWRAVGHTHTAYAVETFIDQLLESAGRDPIKGRLALLKDHPRESEVLRTAAKMARKAGKTPKGRARGVAVHKSFGSYVAQIAEVSKGGDGLPKVERVWCAVDCGIAVNPNVVRAQMEGGIGYGLGAILFDEISLASGGEIAQSNFHNYRSLRISEMPEIEVEIIKSDVDPTGVGEPGTPPIGPAVANAWRRLSKQAVTRLPFTIGVNQA